MAYAAQASSMFDAPTSVLRTPAVSRHSNMVDAKTKRAAAQRRLALVESRLSARASSVLLGPSPAPSCGPSPALSYAPSSALIATPQLNLVSTVSAPVSAAGVGVSIDARASHASQSDAISVEQYLWNACWFLMGFLFLCTT